MPQRFQFLRYSRVPKHPPGTAMRLEGLLHLDTDGVDTAVVVDGPDPQGSSGEFTTKTKLPRQESSVQLNRPVRYDERDITASCANPKLATVADDMVCAPRFVENCAVVL